MMKAKMKKAPYFNEQEKHEQVNAFSDWLVLVGKGAMGAYYRNKEAGKGTHWQMIRERYKLPLDYCPVILDSKTFAEIDRLQIAPSEQRHILFFGVGEIPTMPKAGDDLKTRLLLNLAKHCPNVTTVEWIDEALQRENLFPLLEKIKQGEDTVAEVLKAKIDAQESDSKAEGSEEDKRLPYIEQRTVNGIKGLYRIVPKFSNDTGEFISERCEWLCDPVTVIGIGRSESEDFIVLEWQPEGSKQQVKEAVPLRDLGEREGWRQMKGRGLKLTTKSNLRNELADYLQNTGNRTLWTITNATGWHNGAYILPNGEVIGEPKTPLLFRSQSASFNGYDVKGTIESWQREIAHNVNLNPSMMLGVACSLSAPMIYLLNADSFGVHLFGGSTAGKTTAANIASSIYGNPDLTRLSWNATALGLTNEASARNDSFLPLDEIGQGASKKHVEQTAYTLFNGVGKVQGAKEGGNRELQR